MGKTLQGKCIKILRNEQINVNEGRNKKGTLATRTHHPREAEKLEEGMRRGYGYLTSETDWPMCRFLRVSKIDWEDNRVLVRFSAI